jgi:ubiquinone/menaquinone biosynthesis C-methylase UbiE
LNIDVMLEVFRGLPQQGPGNEECTLRALERIGELPGNPRILDVGCGTGRQTLLLARHCGGQIVAVDLDRDSLGELERLAASAGLAPHITTQQTPMSELEFPDRHFDLIWSEGAIYHMGFEPGLAAWKRFLVPAGHVAVSELSWLTDDPPPNAADFWRTHYPAMQSRAENLRAVERAGYQSIESFVLPEAAWQGYYGPLEDRVAVLRTKYGAAQSDETPGAISTLDEIQEEIDVFRASQGSYSYVFYIARRPS